MRTHSSSYNSTKEGQRATLPLSGISASASAASSASRLSRQQTSATCTSTTLLSTGWATQASREITDTGYSGYQSTVSPSRTEASITEWTGSSHFRLRQNAENLTIHPHFKCHNPAYGRSRAKGLCDAAG